MNPASRMALLGRKVISPVAARTESDRHGSSNAPWPRPHLSTIALTTTPSFSDSAEKGETSPQPSEASSSYKFAKKSVKPQFSRKKKDATEGMEDRCLPASRSTQRGSRVNGKGRESGADDKEKKIWKMKGIRRSVMQKRRVKTLNE